MRIRSYQYGLIAFLSITAWNVPVLRAQSQPGDVIGITPCRVVDTRNANGPFGGPIITGGTTRVFTIPAGACSVPSDAVAYSLNISVVPPGPLGYVTVWPDGQTMPLAATLVDSTGLVLSNGAIVQAGASGAIDVFVSNTTHVIIDINGYFMPQSDPSSESTAVGRGALIGNTGRYNSAFGYDALISPSGGSNTAMGTFALQSTTSGDSNSAFGLSSLATNTTGSNNTALGFYTLQQNTTGNSNTAVGEIALQANTTGNSNTALGYSALGVVSTGSNNIGIGYASGINVAAGSHNIEIGASGAGDESGVIRIGTAGQQTSAYVAGIAGVLVTGGSAVLVDPNTGQLGVASSSARYKEDIQDMGESSDLLMQLRPVTFRYKQPTANGTKPVQYGLIGEEVEKVFPELVVRGRNGEVESVQYHQLPALLLNEVQKEHGVIQEQRNEIGNQQEQIRSLETRITALESLLRTHLPEAATANH